MADWYKIHVNAEELVVEFQSEPNYAFWEPEIIVQQPLTTDRIRGRVIRLSGKGSVWMYAHVAAVVRKAGAVQIRFDPLSPPDGSDDLSYCESLLISAGAKPDTGALLVIQLRPSPRVSAKAVQQLLEPRLNELLRLRPRELVLYGRASVDVYTQAAATAMDAGVKKLSCWSARDGLVVVYDEEGHSLGVRAPRPPWLAQAMPKPQWPVVIGVIGDPNVGKSVFSKVLNLFVSRHANSSWLLDCDGHAPTPEWYISLLQADPQRAQQLRSLCKIPWTPEMETIIVEQLRRARDVFSVLIADLPGGNHSVTPPERIPPTRMGMFDEVDAFILLDREDRPSESAWREALRAYGLESRLLAVLVSREPQAVPSLSVTKRSALCRGTITGLDRSRPADEVLSLIEHNLREFWQHIMTSVRRFTLDAR